MVSKTTMNIVIGIMLFCTGVLVTIAVLTSSGGENQASASNAVQASNVNANTPANAKDNTPQEQATPQENKEADHPLELISHKLEKSDYGDFYYVRGTIKATKSVSYAQVMAKFYDSDGNLVDSGIDNILNLEAGETWSFEVSCLAPDNGNITNYKIYTGHSD